MSYYPSSIGSALFMTHLLTLTERLLCSEIVLEINTYNHLINVCYFQPV